MGSFSACVLVFHGSRDGRSRQAAVALTQRVRQHMQFQSMSCAPLADTGFNPEFSRMKSRLLTCDRKLSACSVMPATPIAIADAYLECHPLPLHQQLQQIAQTVLAQTPPGSEPSHPLEVRVVPVLLLPGVHLKEDIPAEVAIAQSTLPDSITLEITPHLGSCAELSRLLMERMARDPRDAWVLLAHGSRRPGANQGIEELARRIGAIAAFWSTPPPLTTQVQTLYQQGLRKIGIFPYFLFQGGITDAIAQTVTDLADQFPGLSLSLVEPLDASPNITDLLVTLAHCPLSQAPSRPEGQA